MTCVFPPTSPSPTIPTTPKPGHSHVFANGLFKAIGHRANLAEASSPETRETWVRHASDAAASAVLLDQGT